MLHFTRTLDGYAWHIDKDIPKPIRHRYYRNISKLLKKADSSIPTRVSINGILYNPAKLIPLDVHGDVEIIYEGITYVGYIK